MERSEFPDEDPRPFRPPLPPEDRLWRHPSEIGGANAFVGPAPIPKRATPSRSRFAVAVVVGVSGALLVAGLVGLLVRVRGDGGLEEAAGFSVTSLAMSPAASAAAADGTVQIVASVPEGQRESAAVPLDANTLITTTAAVQSASMLVALLPNGKRAEAKLLTVDDESGTALLTVADAMQPMTTGRAAVLDAGTRLRVAGPTSVWGTVTSLGGHTTRADGQKISHLVLLEMDDDRPVQEGAPVVTPDGVVVGVCFHVGADVVAIPIEMSRAVARSHAAIGRMAKPWLGVSGRDADRGDGALLDGVTAGSPAAAAGLRAGDVLTAIGGEGFTSWAGFVLTLRDHDAGTTVLVTYQRGTEIRTASATLGEKAG